MRTRMVKYETLLHKTTRHNRLRSSLPCYCKQAVRFENAYLENQRGCRHRQAGHKRRRNDKSRQISIVLSLIYITVIIVMMNCKIIYAFVILESLTAAVVSMIAGYIKYKKAS